MKWILILALLKISGTVQPSAKLVNGKIAANLPVLVQSSNNVITGINVIKVKAL